MSNSDKFTISKTIKGKLESLPFEKMKNEVLGKNYELSLVFIGTKKSQALNKKYRKKDKPADVLSFPLSKSTGEIFICPKTTKQESIGSLFIHGLMHLKGLRHGSTMEKEEEKIKKKFKI